MLRILGVVSNERNDGLSDLLYRLNELRFMCVLGSHLCHEGINLRLVR